MEGGMSENKYKIPAVETFNRFLAAKHLRRTPERYAVLDVVLKINKHFYIETICEEMAACDFQVSRATVYSTVDLLTEAGILRRHRFGNQPAQYEKVVEGGNTTHQHLVCTRCGKIKEIKDVGILKLLTQKRYQSFTPEYFQFYVYGICSQCNKKIKRHAREGKKG